MYALKQSWVVGWASLRWAQIMHNINTYSYLFTINNEVIFKAVSTTDVRSQLHQILQRFIPHCTSDESQLREDSFRCRTGYLHSSKDPYCCEVCWQTIYSLGLVVSPSLPSVCASVLPSLPFLLDFPSHWKRNVYLKSSPSWCITLCSMAQEWLVFHCWCKLTACCQWSVNVRSDTRDTLNTLSTLDTRHYMVITW